MGMGKYIYCIIDSGEKEEFDLVGIGDTGSLVHTIAFKDIAAVVSDSPLEDYPVSRVNMLAHQTVMEKMMESHAVLPVKFSTIANGSEKWGPVERIKHEVLENRYDEFCELLEKMEGKIELGLKCLWTNMDSIFSEIVNNHTDIKQMKRKIAQGHPIKTRDKRITLGEKVKNALDRQREKEEKVILAILKPICEDLQAGNIFGDAMVVNSSFLVDKTRVEDFDDIVNKLSSNHNGRMKYKYVGPVPPCNFVELTIYLK